VTKRLGFDEHKDTKAQSLKGFLVAWCLPWHRPPGQV